MADDCEVYERTIQTLFESIQKVRAAQNLLHAQVKILGPQVKLLRENVRILKMDSIVTVLSEYKKAKEELAKVEEKHIAINKHYLEATSVLKDFKSQLKSAMDKYTLLKTTAGTILVGNFKGIKDE